MDNLSVTSANDAVAVQIRRRLTAGGITGINVMGSPGAGKTSLITSLAGLLGNTAVIEGDIAGSIDTDALMARGIRARQINTDGMCHLEAGMVADAAGAMDLTGIGYLFVENVGNLVCPAGFDIGMHANIVCASLPEGHDKPYKYPGMFAAADMVLVTKADAAPAFRFDRDGFIQGVSIVNPGAPVLFVSAWTGAEMDAAASVIRGWATRPPKAG